MPVTVTETVATYAGNGSTTVPYPITIPRDQDEDLILTINGVTSTDFSVSPDGFRTGTAISSGSALVLFRRTPRTQVQSFPSNTTPAAEDVRAGLDKLTLGVQEIDEEVGRAIKSPVGEVFASDRTIGIASTGLPIARTAAEEVTFLGIGVSVTDASNSATAAATSASNAATSASYAATFETNAALAVASVLDLSDQAFFKAWFYPDPFAGDPVITGDVVISLPGSPNITIKNSARPYAEDNAINGVGSKVSQLFWDIVNIIKGNVTDYDTSTKYGVGQTTVSNYNPITTWDAKVEPYGNGLTDNSIEPVVTLTYYGPGEGVTLTLPTGLLTNPGTFSPPTAVPFVTHTTAQTLTNAQKLQARDNIGVSAMTLDVSAAPFNAALDWNGTTGTDDTAAIQSALDYAATQGATGKNCHVIIPGRAKITSALIVTAHNGFRLSGVGGPAASSITQTSNSANGITIQMPSGDGTGYCEHLVIENLEINGPGAATSSGTAIYTHDDRHDDDHYNGGGLLLSNLKIGNNDKGFHTGLFLKRWDATRVIDCRIVYNYRNVYCDTFTNTVTFTGGGNAQAESILWDFGKASKVTVINMDNGNSPQFARVGYGSIISFIGGNYETLRHSSTATKKFNYSNTTFPGVTSVSGIDTGTGLITTSAAHGIKPGCYVCFHYATIPTGLDGSKMYEVLSDGFTATTFKISAQSRGGIVTSGGSSITMSGASSVSTDLAVGGKVRIETTPDLSAFSSGEYWVVSKPTTSTITVSLTEGGSAVTFPAAGNIFVVPITELVPSTAGATVLVEAPVFAVENAAYLTLSNTQILSGTTACTSSLVSVGLGSTVYLSNYVLGTGFSGDSGGKIISLTGSGIIDTSNLVAGTGLQQRHSTDALRLDYQPLGMVALPENSGTPASAGNRGKLLFLMARNGMSGGDKILASLETSPGVYSKEPILNKDLRSLTATGAATLNLAVNNRYHSNSSGSAQVCLLPSSAATGDEIEIVGTGSAGFEITQQANQIIRQKASVTTNGATGKITYALGDVAKLKCYATSGNGYWQVIGGSFNGTVV